MTFVSSFSDIQDDFHKAMETIVWCNMATVDSQGRPRSRVLHPMWEGMMGWILTSPISLKAKHLEKNNHISLAYIADPLKPIYIEASVEWVDGESEKQRIWDWFKNTPPPYGYDPAPFFGSVDSPNYGVLKVTPWLIDMHDLMGDSGRKWKA